jgi:hypothetical protein
MHLNKPSNIYEGIEYVKYLVETSEDFITLDINENKYKKQIEILSEDKSMYIRKCVDNVIAICTYFILSFDYTSIFRELISKKSKISGGYEVVWSLLQMSEKQDSKSSSRIIRESILTYIFEGSNRVFGSTTYIAFIAVMLKLPFNIFNLKIIEDTIMNIKKPIVEDIILLSYLLEHFELLDDRASMICLAHLQYLGKFKEFQNELLKNKGGLVISLLKAATHKDAIRYLDELIPTLLNSLMNEISLVKRINEFSLKMRGNGFFKLQIINSTLAKYNHSKAKTKTITGLLYLLYAVEDTVHEDPQLLSNPLLKQVMARFLYVLHEYDMLYASFPFICIEGNPIAYCLSVDEYKKSKCFV